MFKLTVIKLFYTINRIIITMIMNGQPLFNLAISTKQHFSNGIDMTTEKALQVEALVQRQVLSK